MSQSSFRLWIGLLRRCRPPAVTSCSWLASHLHGPPVDFAHQAGHVVRDHIDDVQPERIRGGKTHRTADGMRMNE
jgi:hypothetical protein